MRSKASWGQQLNPIITTRDAKHTRIFYIACCGNKVKNKWKINSFFSQLFCQLFNQKKSFPIGLKCSRNIQGFTMIYEQICWGLKIAN